MVCGGGSENFLGCDFAGLKRLGLDGVCRRRFQDSLLESLFGE